MKDPSVYNTIYLPKKLSWYKLFSVHRVQLEDLIVKFRSDYVTVWIHYCRRNYNLKSATLTFGISAYFSRIKNAVNIFRHLYRDLTSPFSLTWISLGARTSSKHSAEKFEDAFRDLPLFRRGWGVDSASISLLHRELVSRNPREPQSYVDDMAIVERGPPEWSSRTVQDRYITGIPSGMPRYHLS